MMVTKAIARVNNVTILAGNDAEKLVPIKPICEALGIDRKAQQDKIREDEFLSSVGVLSTLTGADGKQYEMFCLPLEFIFGWLFTINPKNVKEEAQEAVRKYRIECYKVLYNHFFGNMKKQIEQNDKELRLFGRNHRIEPAKDRYSQFDFGKETAFGKTSGRTFKERTRTVLTIQRDGNPGQSGSRPFPHRRPSLPLSPKKRW